MPANDDGRGTPAVGAGVPPARPDAPLDKTGWVVDRVLAGQAASRGSAPFLQFGEAPPLTYAEVEEATARLAGGLLAAGLAQGERVGVMLPNSLAYCTSWFALSRLGAVHVAINTAYRGIFLRHVLVNSAARLAIMAPEYLAWLAEIEPEVPALEAVYVPGLAEAQAAGNVPAFSRVRVESWEALLEAGRPVETGVRTVRYHDIAAIMYTSGTTGPSKGVLMPHAHLYGFGLGEVVHLRLVPEDVYYICMPLFHANAMLMQLYGTLIVGARATVVPQFSASRWLDDVRRCGATITNTLGVMTEFLYRQPPRPEDSDHRLRLICAVPTPASFAEDFHQRFGVRLVEGYGMTECNIPLYHPLDEPYRPGSCGKPWTAMFEMRVVDPDTDEPLPTGQMGEIVIRPREPSVFMQGYNDMPEKTVEDWRNLWFHTGDAGHVDADGYFYFRDRIKDRIRVRGENLSSYEIEAVLCDHPAVAEAAAIAVPSGIDAGEDEVKACVVLRDGAALEPAALLDFCCEHMPYFSVPRYVEFMAALPKTPTQKVRKGELRGQGLTSGTWDREAAGYRVKRR